MRWRGAATAQALLWIHALLIASCRSPETSGAHPSPPEGAPTQSSEAAKSSDELTIDSFRDLIARGALRPVEAIEDDGAFADPAATAESFDETARKLERELAGDDATTDNATADNATVGNATVDNTTSVPIPEPVPPPMSTENPYLVFGKRIMVYPDQGLITKPYPLRVGLGAKLKDLLEKYGRFPLYDPASGAQAPGSVRIELLPEWDLELFSDLRAPVPNDGAPLKIADWLVITADFELLREVESFINIFAAGVPQIEIEAKIVEVTTTDALDTGIRPIDDSTPIFGFPDHTFVGGLTYSFRNSSSAANALLTLGAVQDGLAFNAVLQALASYENVSIISRPKIAVREGGKAEIVNTLKLPSYSVNAINAQGQAQAALTYEEVGIKLYIIPRVVGTETVALNIDIEASAQSGSSVSFTLQNGQVISNPILSRRAAKTVVYLEPGQAVILGGLISERMSEIENKVPFLGDIPVLGYLFKSSLKRKEQTNVLFFIRPRILQGTDLNREF